MTARNMAKSKMVRTGGSLESGSTADEPSSRLSISWRAGLVAAVTIGALLAVLCPIMMTQTGVVSQQVAPQETVPVNAVDQPALRGQANPSSISRPAPAQSGRLVHSVEPKPEILQLVDGLVKLQPENGVLTDEFAKGWKQNLRQLIQQGPAAIPAMQDFLARNLDYAFGDSGRQFLGYSSARVAMFDALAQIGGPEAVAALSGVLQTTADPREIALLAQKLEQLEPQQHQAEVLNAARQALALAGSHKQQTADPAPLFEVLQKYGGEGIASELVKSAAQWNSRIGRYIGGCGDSQRDSDCGAAAAEYFRRGVQRYQSPEFRQSHGI